MKNNLLKTLLVLGLTLNLFRAQGDGSQQFSFDETRLPIGQRSQGRATKTQNYRAIKLLQIVQLENRYLFFVISHLKEMKSEAIKMAVFRNEDQTPIVTCESTNTDTCFVSANSVKARDTLVVAIQCQDDCQFTFQSYWSNIESLIPNQTIKFTFVGTMSQIYHLNLENINFKEARVIMVPETKRSPGDAVRVYGSYGYVNNPTPETHDFQSQNLWKDGQGIFLSAQDFKNEKKLTLLVTGQTNTIYSIKAQTIETDNIEIPIRTRKYQYLKKQSEKVYHVSLNGNQTIDQYALHFSKFSGDMKLSFFKDKALTQSYTVKNFQYMNDVKYLILKEEVEKEGLKDLYIKATTSSVAVVFMAVLDSKSINGAVQLLESIYDFVPIHKSKIVYLHFEDFGATSESGKMEEIDFNILRVLGDIRASFRICNGDVGICLNTENYQSQSKELTAVDKTVIGMKFSFKLKVDPKDFQIMHELQRSALIMAIITNQLQTPSLVAVEYSITDDMQDLREGHPLEAMIGTGQKKYYKFMNSDANVQAVRAILSPIRGQFNVYGTRSDPRVNNTTGQISAVGNQVVFSDKLSDPMYVVVEGISPAAFGVSIQLWHKEVKFSSMSLSESIDYNVRIPPGGAEIIRLHPIFSELHFQYKGSGPISVCILDEADMCNSADKRPQVGKKGQINIKEGMNRTSNILVGNPSDTMFVQVKMSYKSSNYDNCKERPMEDLHTENIKHDACFVFPLKQKFEDLIFLIERNDIGPFMADIYVCGEPLDRVATLPRISIANEQITQKCSNKTTGLRIIAIMFKGDSSKPEEIMKVQFSGLYINSIVTLPDGFAFKATGLSLEGKLSTYYYHAVNLVRTTIVLRSFRGDFNFYVKIVDAKSKNQTKINPQDYDFFSQSNNFFKSPALTLTPQDYIKNNCNQCGLLIVVYSQNNIGGAIEYSIEVIQNNYVLKDNQNFENHMSEGSSCYYQYEAHKEQCNLIVEVSDHNKDCAQIYLSNKEHASDDNFLVKETGTKLTYSNCTKGMYYISVLAVKDCAYSISISNSPYSISKIQRGKPANIKLKEGEVKYVIFRHIAPNEFKLATLNKFGAVDIYANQLDPMHLQVLKEGNSLDYKNFQFKSSYTDVLSIDNTDQGFCSNCYYLAAVVAKRETESSLLLADEETPIEMASGKVFNDELLEKGEETVLTFKQILSGVLPFQVHNGELKAVIKYKKQTAQHIFPKKQQLQLYEFKLTPLVGSQDWSPIRVIITCLTPKCAYSVGLLDKTSQVVTGNDIKVTPGKPSYLFLEPNKSSCIIGYVQNKEDDIVVTVDRINTDYLGKIGIKLQVNGTKTTEFIKSSILNVMKISVNFDKLMLKSTTSYRMCLQLGEDYSISAIVDQGEDINLLTEDSEVVVEGQDTFLVYPEGPFLVDIFECSGETTFKHAYEQTSLDDELSDLNSIGMPDQPHAIKITSFLPTFLRIKSPLSIVRWFPINQIEQRGLGYFRYKIGDLHYQTSQNDIQVSWDSLAKVKETNTTLKEIIYTLYISDSIVNLRSAASCEKFLPEDIIVVNLNIPTNQIIDSKVSHTISKSFIGQKFKGRKDNIFMNLVADMILKVPQIQNAGAVKGEPDEEYYRFLYHSQEIPKDVFEGHQGSAFDKPIVLAVVGVSLFLGVLLVGYVILKKIVPIISRMKNRMMVEEQGDGDKKDDIQVDPVIQSNERIVVEDT